MSTRSAPARSATREPQALAIFSRAAEIIPTTFDAEARTVEVIWTTGAAVRRRRWTWDGVEEYDEILSLDAGAVDLSRLNNGAPFLAQHSTGGPLSSGRDALGDVLGVVVEGTAKIEGGRGTATVRFSQREDVGPLMQDVRDGILRNISVGYDPLEWVDRESPGGIIERVVTKWMPYEISAVAMGADDGAKFRARGTTPREDPMKVNRAAGQPAPSHDPAAGAPEPAPPPAEAPLADPAVERAAGFAAGVERQNALLAACARLRLEATDPRVRAVLSDTSIDVPTARERLFELAAGRDDEAGVSGVHGAGVEAGELDEARTRGSAIVAYLSHKADPGRHRLEGAASEYRGMDLLGIARECLDLAGVKTRGMNRYEVARAALRLRQAGDLTVRGIHTTGDFPGLLAAASGKSLRTGYEEAPATYQPLGRLKTVPDFKVQSELILDTASDIQDVNEAGEYKHGTVKEGKETWSVARRGLIIALTPEILMNDDLDAFTEAPMRLGQAAKRKENSLFWGKVTANAALAEDSVALFHATHKNLVSAGGAPSTAQMGKMRKLARQMKSRGGAPLNIPLRFAAYPAALEDAADQLHSPAVVPAQTGNVVPPYIRTITPIIEPVLDGTSEAEWYGFADPGQVNSFVYGYLEGEQGPQIETDIDFNTDGVRIKVRHVFGVGVVDFRGAYKNPGA